MTKLVIVTVLHFVHVYSILASNYKSDYGKLKTDDAKWEKYKGIWGNNGNSTVGAEKDEERKKNFMKTDKMINENNPDGLSLFWLNHNQFSYYSDGERNSSLGLNVDLCSDCSPSANPNTIPLDNRDIFSNSFDLRHEKLACIGDVKDQGKACASSSVYSVMALIEYKYCRKMNNSYNSLSEQEVIACENSYCNGGWPHKTMTYLQSENNGTDENNNRRACIRIQTLGYKITSIHKLEHPNVYTSHVENNGVLSAVMTVVNNFFNYENGIYEDATCNRWTVNHAVAIIGYDQETRPNHPLQEKRTTLYWIVRNSWGSRWGYKGYFHIKRNVNMCNIENNVYYIDL